MRYVYLLLLTLLTYQEALAAGQSYSLSGELTTNSTTDFSSMQVELQGLGPASGHPVERGQVSNDGRFDLHNVPEGQYTLTVSTAMGTPVYRDIVSIYSYDKRVSLRLPSTPVERPVTGLVSIAQLRHKPPKAARKAFDQSVKLYQKKDIPGSLALLERAVSLDPEYVQALNNLGARYLMVGRLDQSIATLRHAIELDPHAALIHSNLAHAFLLNGEAGQAEITARRAVDLDQSDARGSYMLGLSLVLQQKYTPEAVASLRRSYEFSSRARLALGLVLANTGSVDDARKAFSSCLQSTDPPVRAEAQRMLTSLRSR